MNKKNFGSLGEKLAVDFLAKNGYRILASNYRVGRLGEIDIIAWEKEYICFIEVKTRKSVFFGLPCEAVNRRKQDKITRLASFYINQYKLNGRNVRFDVVEILIEGAEDAYSIKDINLIRNAF